MTRRKFSTQCQVASQFPIRGPPNGKPSSEKELDSSATEAQHQPQHASKMSTTYEPWLEFMNPAPIATSPKDTDNGDEDDTFVIHTNLLIPGKGDPTKNSTVVTSAGKIVYVGSHLDFPKKPEYQTAPSTFVPVLMPGLWDCHVHLVGSDSFGYTSLTLTNPATAGVASPGLSMTSS